MIRLQDIAEMAGVSRTTVSNVINGNTKRVSQKTIDKITTILKEQNYVPHMGSVMLSGHGSRIIGVVLGFSYAHGMQSLQDPFVGELIGTIQMETEENGYYVMLIGGESIQNVVDIASKWNVEGLLILGYNEEQYRSLSRRLNKKMILIDAYPEGAYTFQNVGIDDYSGGYQIGEYLYSCAIARPIPVFPEVPSMIVPPGFNFPSCSAAAIMFTAIRSFTLPPGLKYSSFPRILAWLPSSSSIL